MEFGEMLAKVRKASGMSQKELAEQLGVYQKDISRWENGSRVPSLQTFKEICKALHVSADEMLELTDEK